MSEKDKSRCYQVTAEDGTTLFLGWITKEELERDYIPTFKFQGELTIKIVSEDE